MLLLHAVYKEIFDYKKIGRMLVALLTLSTSLVATQQVADAGATSNNIRITALGDSYTANPGASESHSGGDCARSSSAYPYRLASLIGGTSRVNMEACTGGITVDIFDQLESMSGADKINTDLVLLTTGGNDAYFAAIAGLCIAPQEGLIADVDRYLDTFSLGWRALSANNDVMTGDACKTLLDNAIKVIPRVRATTLAALEQIKLQMPYARIVLLGYPGLVSEGCSSMRIGKHNFAAELRNTQQFFDQVQKEIISDMNKKYPDFFRYVPMSGIYSGHGVCDDQPEGSSWLLEAGDGSNVVRWYHPNATGNQATAQYLFNLGVHDGLPLVGDNQFSGDIVKWTGDNTTSWLVDSSGNRYWIETAEVYNCLRANGSTVHSLNTGQLSALPDQIGQHARCTPNSSDGGNSGGSTTPLPPTYNATSTAFPLECGVTVPFVSTYDTFGNFNHGEAIDVPAPAGTKVVAPIGGIATVLSDPQGYGNYVDLVGNDGLTHRFAHLLGNGLVESGSYVNQGEVIGLVGSTGASTGAHLHYEQRNNAGQVPVSIDGIDLVWGPRFTEGGDRRTVHSITSNNCEVIYTHTTVHRWAELTESGDLRAKEGATGVNQTWTLLMDNVQDYALEGTRIFALHDNGDLYAKNGALNASWLKLAGGVDMFWVEGDRVIIVKPNKEMYAKEGPLNAKWRRLSSNVVDVAMDGDWLIYLRTNGRAYWRGEDLSRSGVALYDNVQEIGVEGDRIFFLTDGDDLVVKDGRVGAPNVKVADNIIDFDAQGDRIAVVYFNGDTYVKDGALNANWSPLLGRSGVEVQLEGNRIGLLQSDGDVHIKEGPLNATWTLVTDHAESFQLYQDRIGVIRSGNDFNLKVGAVNQTWTLQGDAADSFVLSSYVTTTE